MTLNFEIPLAGPADPCRCRCRRSWSRWRPYVGHRLLRETMLEASTALALCPDPERDYPGGLAEFCQALTLRVYNRVLSELVKADPEVMTDAWQSLLRRYDADTG